MAVLGRYLYRLARLWISWLFAAMDVLGLLTFVSPRLVHFLSPYEWVYPTYFTAVNIIGFLGANAKLFADHEAEKRALQSRIDELEDMRADIRFRKTKDCAGIPHGPEYYFELDYDQKRRVQSQSGLDQEGLPVGIVLEAELRGEKKSSESGLLVWKIVEAVLPPLFALDPGSRGSFGWRRLDSRLERVDGWKDDFRAVYELPVRIAQGITPELLAQKLTSMDAYRIVIQYHTERGIDSNSKTHCLVLEGDFGWFRDSLCERWELHGFEKLAELARCQRM